MTAVRPRRRTPLGALSPAQVNLWLAVCLGGAVVTGLVSWAVGTEWSRLWTVLHAVFGIMVLVLTPAKARRSVRPGLRRGRSSRWISIAFGVVVIATIGLGFTHSTGIWSGVGYWAPLWTHFLLAFAAVPLLLWHVLARPVRPKPTDLDRRMLLGGGVAAGVAAVAVGAIEVTTRAAGTPGATRRFTGSHEVGSMDPTAMPTVSWIDDTAPRTAREDWVFQVDGVPVDLDQLATRSRTVEAALDCTGGWFSTQAWDVVPVADLFTATSRSFKVVSATGYSVLFPLRDAAEVYVAVGYGGQPLRRGHGAPIRIVAPGRRGPWWVKWVTAIEPSERPWWFQSPFPTT